MARTIRLLRDDSRVMTVQSEELFDLCALLARNEPLILDTMCAIGIELHDARAIVQVGQ